MSKPKLSRFITPIVRRLVNPAALFRAASLQFRRRAHGRTEDAQLDFYHALLGSDFLHYGYFDDPDLDPAEMSLNDLIRAQYRYAEQLLELANPDRSGEVLDIGCGMGGLITMLRQRGYAPAAVTPDHGQIRYVRGKHPGVPTYCCKFEDLDPAEHAARYTTIFTSESLQYLRLQRALPLLEKILRPGGTWVACDYFNRDPGNPARRLPAWPDFQPLIAEAGWKVVSQRDITANVLPTLRSVHMWATRAGLPAMRFFLTKLQRKAPGLHYLLAGALPELNRFVDESVLTITPEHFAKTRQYMLFSLQRA